MSKRILIAITMVLLLVGQANAFWVWTPQSKKLTNPKWTAKDSPQEQFAYAKEVFESKAYKDAYKEFRSLLRHFPEAVEAPEAQFYIGKTLREMGKLYEAYLAFQKVIDKYPFSDKMNDVLKEQFELANLFTEKKVKVLGLDFPQQYYAIDIYRKVIENYPYGELAPLSQYKIGMVLKSLGSFSEAKTEFEKVITNYPESEWVEPAKYQAADSASLASLKADYDQALSKEAKERFEDFVEEHPDATLSDETKEQIQALTDKEAEKSFSIAQFYEKQKAYTSAEIYYNDVIKNYPRSSWAGKAQERLKKLREKEKL